MAGLKRHPQTVVRENLLPRRVRSAARTRLPIPDHLAQRLPPGQFLATRWPVLHQGDIPEFNPEHWDFRVWGLVERPITLRWDEFQSLPHTAARGDLHCVTRWSSLDHLWGGVLARTLLERAGILPVARFVLLHGEGGYTANLPLEAIVDEDMILATHHDGEPLAPKHGAPLRAIAPKRYAWKSVKWLRGIEVLAEDRPGFWEEYGYSNSADAWREERFAP